MLPAGLPVPTLAVIPVIAVVPTNVREGRRTTAEAKREQPNAGQSVVIAVPHAQAGVPLIPVPLSVITNAAAPAGLVQPLVRPVLPPPTPAVAAVRQETNAEPRPVIILINPAARLMVMKADVTAILVPTVAVVPENVVVPAPNQNAPDRLTVWSFILVNKPAQAGNMTANTILTVTIAKPHFKLCLLYTSPSPRDA